LVTTAAIRVLLADDDEDYAASLGRLIDEQPELIVVGVAHDGLETVRLAEELEPDAVIVDLHMPLLHGVDAVGEIRRKHPHVCLIAITGDSDESLHQAAARAGADGVLVKGEIVAALVERIRGGRT
jgi:two-component system, NarL family, nitrate/nitrite response regulator NarL